jgi:ABC-type Fe3+-hydroxamate transport system substrate-binding protein
MKKLLFICLAIAVIFSACKKEEETPTNNTATAYAFSCKIDGADFTDNSPVATIIPPNTLQIVASNGSDEVIIYIYNFSNRTEGEEISLNATNRVYVNLGTDYYSNTISGKLIFSKTGNPVSGTFDVICANTQSALVSVTEGEFVDVAY